MHLRVQPVAKVFLKAENVCLAAFDIVDDTHEAVAVVCFVIHIAVYVELEHFDASYRCLVRNIHRDVFPYWHIAQDEA